MRQRMITAMVALLIFIPILLYGGIPFVLLTYAMATVALFELLRMRQISLHTYPAITTFLFLWMLLIPSSVSLPIEKKEIIILFVMIILFYTVLSKNKFTFEHSGFVFIAMIYIGMGFFFFMETRFSGLPFVLYLMFTVWSTDTGAYFIGKSLGKNKLWPEISPNKTIEGALGGIVFALVVGHLFYSIYPLPVTNIQLILMTILLSISGQIGDLVASAYKRYYQVKDTGTLLPGHGGILDRMDSMLFVFPLFYVIMQLF